MKKIAASVGLIALSTAFARAADDSYSSAEAGKIWQVSASLRGFYDDNINGTPGGSANRTSSTGFSVSPSGTLNWQRDATTIDFTYRYSLLYYGTKPNNNRNHYDQNHTIEAQLSHIINERYKFRVSDSFVVGQEPDTLRSGNALTTTQRVPGNNIRNTGAIIFNAELTPLFGLEAGYENTLFSYDTSGATIVNPTNVIPSLAGSSDQLSHQLHLDGRWQLAPTTTGILGYKFSQVNYTGNELIAISATGTPFFSNNRNSRSHYAYVGAEHIFNPDLQGSAKVGATFTDYYKDPSHQNSVNPYVDLSLSYTYAPESSLSAGFTYDHNSTATIGQVSTTKGLTVSQQSATVFASINHRIVPGLFAALTASYQDSTFVGGQFNNQSERYFLIGLNVHYKFTHYLSAELGYDYDNISSVNGRAYDRNKVYAGISGTY